MKFASRLPAPQPCGATEPPGGQLSEPDSEAAPPEEEAPAAPWSSSVRVLPTSVARRIRRGSSNQSLRAPTVDEQQRLLEWAEHLHQETANLTSERDTARRELVACRLEVDQLKVQLEQAKGRCAAFERVGACGTAADHAAENAQLRKQLSETARQIENLSQENEGLRTHKETSEQVMQGLHSERQELKQAHRMLHEEHEQSQAERMRLQDLHSHEREHRQRLELQLQTHLQEKEEAVTIRQETLQQAHQKVWQDLQTTRQMYKNKDQRLQSFLHLAQDAMSMLTELQEKFVEQTRQYQELSQRVRAQQQELQKDVSEAERVAVLSHQLAGDLQGLLGHTREMNSAGEEQWKREAHRLEEQVQNLTANHREAARAVREFRKADDVRKQEEMQRIAEEAREAEERKQRKLERHGLITNPNIIRQMAQAISGIEVEKIDQKNRREKRKLQVWDKRSRGDGLPASSQFHLRWSKAPYREWPDRSSCDLSQVMSLGYAFAARASWLFDVPPHHCFSVHMPSRSFDFICNSDKDVEALVLVISRLCTRIQGWPLHGGVSSHAKFTAMKGWSKVQAACRANRNTLSNHLLEAAAKMPSRPSQLPPPPPAETFDEEAGSSESWSVQGP
mmetsp:Transcript_729/g.1967  ORF Transcript_729/g.1967 Transcript_729/m.1967 type:complete len:621 (-) Transcript_729:129-1991(-)